MELWIRSQKNEKLRQGLLKVNEIEIGDYDDDMNCLVANNLYCIGIYKTKERALEVLESIQDILIAKYVTSLDSKAAMLETEEETTKALKMMAVYEMPEE